MTTPTATEPCQHPSEKVEYLIQERKHACACGVTWDKDAKKPRPAAPRVPFFLMREVQKRVEEMDSRVYLASMRHALVEYSNRCGDGTAEEYESAVRLAALGLNAARVCRYEPPAETAKALELPQGCQHVVVPEKSGWGRCIECKEDGFPLTPEAAGECPGCGGHGNCPEGCDGKTPRMPWALARRALSNLAQHMVTPAPGSCPRCAQHVLHSLVEEDLHRIAGNLRTYPIPIKGTGRTVLVEYLDYHPLRVVSGVANTREEVEQALASAGLGLKRETVEPFSFFAQNAEHGTITAEVELLSTRVENVKSQE